MSEFKKKFDVKLLGKPDGFSNFFAMSIERLWPYWKQILACIGIAIFIFSAVIITHHNVMIRETIVREKLYEAEKLYETILKNTNHEQAYDKVKDHFSMIIDGKNSKKITQLAKIKFAKISYDAGVFDTAISLYSDILYEYDGDMMLKTALLDGLSHSYLSNGDITEAIGCFEKILLEDKPLMKEDALFNIASIYETIGNIDKAKQLYVQFLANFPDSFYAQLVAEKLS